MGDEERTFNGSNQNWWFFEQRERHWFFFTLNGKSHTLTAYFILNQRQKYRARESQVSFSMHLICIIWTSYQMMRPKTLPSLYSGSSLASNRKKKRFCKVESGHIKIDQKQLIYFKYTVIQYTCIAGIWPTTSHQKWSWDQGLIFMFHLWALIVCLSVYFIYYYFFK